MSVITRGYPVNDSQIQKCSNLWVAKQTNSLVLQLMTDPLDTKHPLAGQLGTFTGSPSQGLPSVLICLTRSHTLAQQVWLISAIFSSAQPARHANLRDQNRILMYYDVTWLINPIMMIILIYYDAVMFKIMTLWQWNMTQGHHKAAPLAQQAPHEQSFVGSLGATRTCFPWKPLSPTMEATL